MSSFSPLINQLMDALRCLPGVGPKSAQRMAFHLLQHHRDKAQHLAESLQAAAQYVAHCQRCNILSEHALCAICANQKRDPSLLCIVESPSDVVAIEQTASYSGYYFVLMGRLSPIDGLGPEDIGVDKLQQRLQHHPPQEVILATNPTVEGEATAHYLFTLLQRANVKVSRIAHGVPMGGELEFIDGNTLRYAFSDRKPFL